MAVVTKTGSFTLSTSNGNQSVTGLGFQPKAIIFTFIPETGAINDFGSSGSIAFGMATSSTNRMVISRAKGSTAATRTDDTKCIAYYSIAGAKVLEADFVSMDSGGFTINNTTAYTTGWVVTYWAIGGADITNAVIKEFTSPASTGLASITGVGFQPQAMIVASAGLTTAATTSTTHAIMGLGMAVGSQMGTSTITDITRYQTTTELMTVYSTGSTKAIEYALTSMDLDGFTLNHTTTTSGAYSWALCLRGGSYWVGTGLQPTSTIPVTYNLPSGYTWTPTGVFVTSVNNTAGAAVDTATSSIVIGSTSSTSNMQYIWTGDKTSAVDARALNLGNVIASYTPSNSSLNPTSQAYVSALSAGSFAFTWGTADATQRQFLYLAVGNANTATPLGKDISPLNNTLGSNTTQAVNRSNTF